MKLLFDQNLSPRLPRLLADIYTDSVHVREIGLRDSGDIVIWEYAKEHGTRLCNRFEGLRFPTEKSLTWWPSEIYLVARGQLSDRDGRKFIEKTLCSHTHLWTGSDQVPFDATLTCPCSRTKGLHK